MIDGLPYRGGGDELDGRPGIPLPPGRMPLSRGRRPLKRWRYVGVFDERLMLCVGDAHVGPSRQTFWAVWDRERRALRERTAWLRHRHVTLAPGIVRVRCGPIDVDLKLDEQPGVQTICPHGDQYAWTRKQGGVRATGRVRLDDRELKLDALAVIDDSAGYHARETAWCWSAGVGETPAGVPVAWNLVSGINDPPSGSERSVWLEGEPREAPPVAFDEELRSLRADDGSVLSFQVEATRARSDNLLLLASDYSQPFGSFSGMLPGGIELKSGLGVMERHRARW